MVFVNMNVTEETLEDTYPGRVCVSKTAEKNIHKSVIYLPLQLWVVLLFKLQESPYGDIYVIPQHC